MSDRHDKSTRIGMVGLGIMGAPLVRRFREMGAPVTVWNLEPERFDEVKASGAEWADSPAEVWSSSDVACVCVLGDDAIESVCLGDRGFATALGAQVLVDFSTTSPEATARVAPALKDATGAEWVDAPMSGGPGAAEEGDVTLMIGGDEKTCDKVMPLLDLVAGNVTRMGDLGAGQKTKVLNQAIVGVNYVLMAELLAIAKAAGIDPTLLPGSLKGGMADSTILQRIYTQMAHDDFDPPRSYARQLNKDLKAVRSFVETLRLELPVLARAIEQYRAYTEAGNEMQDGASVSRLYES
ncbi:NAD-binding protein [Rhodobacteraceae bacterium 2CG4]|uniref:NAD-binding protein n=1 Tax=Halovulum marinum TaxID=2662447 RepID=A0A6L5YYQ9_9RHOB|nr:NAD(P)-dependent oxidoreductase [Halovulum marinum]MSU89338.1 NAD-binding protein [Halovulum marinum]